MKHFTITLDEDEIRIIEGMIEENTFETWTNASIEDAIIKGIFEQIMDQTKPPSEVELGGEG